MKFIITESQKNKMVKKYLKEQDSSSDGGLSLGDIGRQAIEYAKKLIRDKDSGSSSSSNNGSSHDGASSTSSTPSGPVSIGNVSAKGQELLNNPNFKSKLSEISSAIGIDENSIIKLMQHESGLNPSVKNSIGCVGLIQFCPDGKNGTTKTISGKKYSLEDIRTNLDTQMEAIKEFWMAGHKSGKIKTPTDLYIFNFWPVAAGKPNDYVLQTNGMSAQTVAKANPVFNKKLGKPVDTPLTVGDLNQYYRTTGMV
jgi:hypothetical protein